VAGERRAFQIPARIHGHYVVEASDAAVPLPLLVGFHGYAETAERHLDALRELPGAESWRRCAVQGLHSFYRNRGAEVVSSWMTRFNREQAIEDNLRYVGDAVTAIRRDFPGEGPLVYAGFSQGAAMAYRAAQRAGHRCDALLILGGDLPPDVAAGDLARLPRVLIGRGTSDPWYSEETLARDIEQLGGAGIRVEACRFEGGHEWGAGFYEAAGRLLASIAA